MRGVFDEEDHDPALESRDKELTLGSGTLMVLLVGLLLLCTLCFTFGYFVGHRGQKTAGPVVPAAPGEQEPLQPNGAIPKPSPIAQSVIARPADPPPADTLAPSSVIPAVQAAPASAAATQVSVPPAQGPALQPQQPLVHAALPNGAAPDAQQSASAVHPALPSSASIWVQIAAVSNPEDADVLVNALRKRGYAVTPRHEPSDNLIHVRIGPFSARSEADQWRMKLLNDGYNAVVQP